MAAAAVSSAAAAAAKPALRVVAFYSSARKSAAFWGGPDRLGTRVGRFVEQHMRERGYEVEIVDPLTVELPILDKPVFYYKPGSPDIPPVLQALSDKIQAADAIVVVSAEYNHSIPPALSNILDHFGGSKYAWKPSGIVCYSNGQFGGMRAAMQLRQLLGELGCLSVSNICAYPKASEQFNEDGTPTNDRAASGLDRMLVQLEWWAEAARAKRDADGTPS